LPAPRHRRLDEFRVAVWASSPLCRIDTSVSDLFDRAVSAILRAGAAVDRQAKAARLAPAIAKYPLRLILGAYSARR